MALLPADPKQRKQYLALMAVIIAMAWYAFRVYVYTPQQETVAALATHFESLQSTNRRSKAMAGRYDDLRGRMEAYERQLRIFEEFIPQSEEVPALLDAISREGQLTGVELARIIPQAAEPGDFYTKQTWELSILGEYHDVGRYISRIASLPRIIKPTRLSLTPAARTRATRDMEAPLHATFIIETFVLGASSGSGAQGASSGG